MKNHRGEEVNEKNGVQLDSLCFLSRPCAKRTAFTKVLAGVYGFPPNPKADFVSQSGVQVCVKKTLSDLEGADKMFVVGVCVVSVSSTKKSPKTNNLKQQVTHRFGR